MKNKITLKNIINNLNTNDWGYISYTNAGSGGLTFIIGRIYKLYKIKREMFNDLGKVENNNFNKVFKEYLFKINKKCDICQDYFDCSEDIQIILQSKIQNVGSKIIELIICHESCK